MLSGQVRVRGTKVLFRGQLEAWEAKQTGMWQGPIWQHRVIYEWGGDQFLPLSLSSIPHFSFPCCCLLRPPDYRFASGTGDLCLEVSGLRASGLSGSVGT